MGLNIFRQACSNIRQSQIDIGNIWPLNHFLLPKAKKPILPVSSYREPRSERKGGGGKTFEAAPGQGAPAIYGGQGLAPEGAAVLPAALASGVPR